MMRKRRIWGVALMLLGCVCQVQAQDDVLMLLGTYTYGGSKGVYTYRFNQTTGTAVPLDSLELRNPSYLTASRDGRLIYAVSETGDGEAALTFI